jgi:hypothetical protein
LDALNGGEMEFELSYGRVSSVAIPKGAKPGDIIKIRVGNEMGKGKKVGFAGADDGHPRRSATTAVTAA